MQTFGHLAWIFLSNFSVNTLKTINFPHVLFGQLSFSLHWVLQHKRPAAKNGSLAMLMFVVTALTPSINTVSFKPFSGWSFFAVLSYFSYSCSVSSLTSDQIDDWMNCSLRVDLWPFHIHLINILVSLTRQITQRFLTKSFLRSF